jgi:hypothetical protein
MPTYPRAPAPFASHKPSPSTDLLDLIHSAATGLFPGAALEALIARWEGGK